MGFSQGRRDSGWDISKYRTLDSTNLEARRLLDSGAGPGLVVWSHHQTGGMGRLGRRWLDLPGKSLMVSLILEHMPGFAASALVSLSVRAAIIGLGGRGPLFKWPNDLVYEKRKAGGLLSEVCSIRGREYIICGLGLNVGYHPGELDFPSKLPPTSLLIEEKIIFDMEALLLGMLRELDARLGKSSEDWLSEYRGNLAWLDQAVRVAAPYSVLEQEGASSGDIEGIIKGIDDLGNLLLEVDGRLLCIAAGDVTPGESA
jgi:BirA family biotin operon repressor/biotin-[acetyl-CoA-carboxylase] ligase